MDSLSIEYNLWKPIVLLAYWLILNQQQVRVLSYIDFASNIINYLINYSSF